MEARYHTMLLARSGEERLRRAGSMHSAARRLAVAAILAADPSASPAAIRRALFLRFYGHEFEGAARERILARLGRDGDEAPGAAMLDCPDVTGSGGSGAGSAHYVRGRGGVG